MEHYAPWKNPLFEDSHTADSEGCLEAVEEEEEKASNENDESPQSSGGSGERPIGSYIVLVTYSAITALCLSSSSYHHFLVLYAQNKFDWDTTSISALMSIGELLSFMLPSVLQLRPGLVKPGGLVACIAYALALLAMFFSDSEQADTSITGVGLFAFGVVTSVSAF
ncbi:hypothetical protein CYMTET_23337 [Cymbomonas tetramitiformis]|uniref:Uncharacterized protein n=1 Tax=Cymbomonas tetramitiformis TaxID=36881 RepID=A0AAE0L114_9CHLO|nr:hypothetical protein CYMTET_23337 [Cymbomonas tetramitiformis]